MTDDEPLVVPPINFSLVAPGLYRSGHPNLKNLGFLKRLHLKSLVYLEEGEYRPDARGFVQSEGCQFWQFPLGGKEKDLFEEEGQKRVFEALSVVLDTRNYPRELHVERSAGGLD
jgi:tyrosine-protein phosphatase SIW14